MARTRSEFLKAFGTAFEIFKAISDEVINRGGTDDDLRRLISDRTLRGRVADLILNKDPAAALSDVYKVAVNYGRKLKMAIKAGKYDWTNDYYNGQEFSDWKAPDGSPLDVPGRGTTEKELMLFHLGAHFGEDQNPSTDEVLAAITDLGLKAEGVQELLAFGEENPDVQREFPIIELGSVWVDPHGDRRVAVLWRFSGGRPLDLLWCGPRWRPDDRVLVSRA